MSTRIALLPLAVLAGGCWQHSYAFPTADDVRMGRSEADSMRDASPAEYGDVYALGMQTAHEVNGWIAEGVDASARVLRLLEKLPATSHDGDFDVFGPYHDAETDLSWMIRIEGDDAQSHFEVLVGAGDGTPTDELLDGAIAIDGDVRSGTFAVSFDTVEKYDLKHGPDRDRTYQGSMEIRFERDTSTEHKLVDIVFDDFEVTQEFPIKEYFSADRYSFRRNADGAGEFVFGLVSTFQAQVWSGPQRERMTLELAWSSSGAGTGKEQVLELEDGEGDLAYGDIVLEECFDDDGYFTWRQLNEPYAGAFPEYAAGDPATCIDLDEELPEFGAPQ